MLYWLIRSGTVWRVGKFCQCAYESSFNCVWSFYCEAHCVRRCRSRSHMFALGTFYHIVTNVNIPSFVIRGTACFSCFIDIPCGCFSSVAIWAQALEVRFGVTAAVRKRNDMVCFKGCRKKISARPGALPLLFACYFFL